MDCKTRGTDIQAAKRRFSSGRHAAAIFPALALLAVAGLAAPGLAHAEPVTVEGQVNCSSGCLDSFEVKCTQASRFLQVRIEVLNPSDDTYARFQMTALGTMPTTMKDQDFARVAEDSTKSTFMLRPGPEGTMRALVAVSPILNVAPLPSYRLTAECFAGVGFGGPPVVTRKTTMTQRVDQ